MLGDFEAGATLAVTDLAAARGFYEGTLGFAPTETGYPDSVLYSAGSGKFMVYQSQFAGTNKATAISFVVPDEQFDAELAALRAKGITLDTFDISGFEGASWDEGVLVGMGGKSAWFHDPDGNIFNVGTMSG